MVWMIFKILLTLTLAAFLADAAFLSKLLLDENPCNCPTYVFPVCGSNGRTYRNECYFFCDRQNDETLWKATNTPCKDVEVLLTRSVTNAITNCICPHVFFPVCGSNGVAYPNSCYLDCAKKKNSALYKKHNGYCDLIDVPQKSKATDDSMLSGCLCSKLFLPVCGSDGITYINDCYLDCAKTAHFPVLVFKKYYGYCGYSDVSQKSKTTDDNMLSGCMCPQFLLPVCGSDGITYINDCYLNCAKIKLSSVMLFKKHEGYCHVYEVSLKSKLSDIDPPLGCTCPETFQPVCGSNGVTYINVCFLDCDSFKRFETLYVWHDGVCVNGLPQNTVTPSKGLEQHGEVVSADFIDQIKTKQQTERHPQEVNCSCPSNYYNPVCGTDGVTYKNICFLECAIINSEKKMWKAHDGSCDDTNKRFSDLIIYDMAITLCGCSKQQYPVCGSDGVTYQNECFLDCQKFFSNHGLWKDYDGNCSKTDRNSQRYMKGIDWCRCSRNEELVCGSDGKTYHNECYLKCEQFFHNHALWKDYDGACKENIETPLQNKQDGWFCSCPAYYAPVCGTRGGRNVTYRNQCIFDCVKSFRSDIHMLHNGECTEDERVHRLESALQYGDDWGNWEWDSYVHGLRGVAAMNLDTISAVGEQKECIEDMEWNPVCGTDGRTYMNDALLACVQMHYAPDLMKVHDGKCEDVDKRMITKYQLQDKKKCIEGMEWKPVCGTDGRTYRNEALLDCIKMHFDPDLMKVHDGKCEEGDERMIAKYQLQDKKKCIEEMEWKPVCGTDGRTYRNQALLECIKMHFDPDLMKVHDGKCEEGDERMIAKYQDEEHCYCPTTYKPLCASDGTKYITYKNSCIFQCVNLKYPRLRKVHEGKCRYGSAALSEVTIEENLRNCTDRCSPIYEPICGNDGQTYVNTCYLLCYKLIISVYLQPKHMGKCIVDSSQEGSQLSYTHSEICSCSDVTDEVCGSDGVTYKNECLLKCIRNLHNKYDLEKKYNGRCKILGCACPSERDPVCGSDNKTYKNMCFLKCEQETYHKAALFFIYSGRCRG